jgi:hypothetical protein
LEVFSCLWKDYNIHVLSKALCAVDCSTMVL